eukprot:11899268-Ditylum_brightwellii.AAC.1
MSKHILQWNKFQRQCLISNSQCYTTSLDEIFEELIDAGIPVDTMLKPTSVPAMIPTSSTAASTSLPHLHINRAFTPNTSHPKQHKYRQYQSKKQTYNTDFAGCPGCQADAEDQLNIVNQILHHDVSICPLLNNASIRDKSICEAVKQHNVKNLHNSKLWKELDYQRKPACLAAILSLKVKSILLHHEPEIIQYNAIQYP